jgi:hypothetical protein
MSQVTGPATHESVLAVQMRQVLEHGFPDTEFEVTPGPGAAPPRMIKWLDGPTVKDVAEVLGGLPDTFAKRAPSELTMMAYALDRWVRGAPGPGTFREARTFDCRSMDAAELELARLVLAAARPRPATRSQLFVEDNSRISVAACLRDVKVWAEVAAAAADIDLRTLRGRRSPCHSTVSGDTVTG